MNEPSNLLGARGPSSNGAAATQAPLSPQSLSRRERPEVAVEWKASSPPGPGASTIMRHRKKRISIRQDTARNKTGKKRTPRKCTRVHRRFLSEEPRVAFATLEDVL
ncbi:unnamed protein product [Lasius platythorax]|uniref:Uncharacterized protein n=1 Tax=Lasius platythorax TaxID=488582 RepID=A0AAV2N855_9HYME